MRRLWLAVLLALTTPASAYRLVESQTGLYYLIGPYDVPIIDTNTNLPLWFHDQATAGWAFARFAEMYPGSAVGVYASGPSYRLELEPGDPYPEPEPEPEPKPQPPPQPEPPPQPQPKPQPQPEPEPAPPPANPTEVLVRLSWDRPPARADGSPLAAAEISHYNLYWSSDKYPSDHPVALPREPTALEFALPIGDTYYFTLDCVALEGNISPRGIGVSLGV